MKLSTTIPRAYLGTMTFGWSQTSSYVDESIALKMVERFVAFDESIGQIDDHRIDTARIYAGGKTETIVGRVLEKLSSKSKSSKTMSEKLTVGTKAAPSVKPGGLSRDGILDQFDASMEAMGLLAECGEYYLHQPDPDHPLLESLEAADDLVKQGKIRSVGMSNYRASEVARAFELCDERGLTRPTVYQGLYNPLNRMVEKDLLPLLRENGCSFVAYNPLAGGLLTGKHRDDDAEDPAEKTAAVVAKGRFRKNQNYLPRFYTSANFEAVRILSDRCEKDGITLVEATFRWMLRHSALGPDDGYLLGASSLDQLDENLRACASAAAYDDDSAAAGSLSPEMLEAFEEAWNLTADGAFPYWRSYSSDMPGREAMDPGASYKATKK